MVVSLVFERGKVFRTKQKCYYATITDGYRQSEAINRLPLFLDQNDDPAQRAAYTAGRYSDSPRYRSLKTHPNHISNHGHLTHPRVFTTRPHACPIAHPLTAPDTVFATNHTPNHRNIFPRHPFLPLTLVPITSPITQIFTPAGSHIQIPEPDLPDCPPRLCFSM
jgi:hypothetical protein